MLAVMDKMYWSAKMKIHEFFYQEEGEVNIVTIVVLIGIAVALALIFKDRIIGLLNILFGAITEQAEGAVTGK